MEPGSVFMSIVFASSYLMQISFIESGQSLCPVLSAVFYSYPICRPYAHQTARIDSNWLAVPCFLVHDEFLLSSENLHHIVHLGFYLVCSVVILPVSTHAH